MWLYDVHRHQKYIKLYLYWEVGRRIFSFDDIVQVLSIMFLIRYKETWDLTRIRERLGLGTVTRVLSLEYDS